MQVTGTEEVTHAGFWSIWFKLGLYDLLTPINYDRSLAEAFALLEPRPQDHIADFGSGSGRLLVHARDWLKSGGRICAIDVDRNGLKFASTRAVRMGVSDNLALELLDLTAILPKPPTPFAGGIAHFALYTVASEGSRRQMLRNMHSYLKPGATLILTVPNEDYRVARIIADAKRIESSRTDCSPTMAKLRQHGLYRVTGAALMKVEKAIDQGIFKKFSREQIKSEVTRVGFRVDAMHSTYGGAAYHLCLSTTA